MGIKGLLSRIEEYGKPFVPEQAGRADTRKLAIVDGPSLAHAVYDRQPAGVNTNRYAATCQRTIAFLDRLYAAGYET
jgi:hypothetical protein